MALRFVHIFIPSGESLDLASLAEDYRLLGTRRDAEDEERLVAELLVSAEEAEELLDRCEEAFEGREGFRAILLPVEAVVPRPADDEKGDSGAESEAGDDDENQTSNRVSREELYGDLSDTLRNHRVFVAMALLSTVVAAVGLLRDNVAVLVGAMVIAPLLGPNIALCLAATLGDLELMRRAMITNLTGLLGALALSVGVGVALTIDPQIPAIASRTRVDLGDLVLGLAAGAAGTLAYTRALAGPVIGVMVAVALVPPLVCFGLLLGDGHVEASVGALALLATNIVCINLAGIGTFLLQGVRPRTWWEEERAKRATKIAITVWSLLLLALGAIVWWTQPTVS